MCSKNKSLFLLCECVNRASINIILWLFAQVGARSTFSHVIIRSKSTPKVCCYSFCLPCWQQTLNPIPRAAHRVINSLGLPFNGVVSSAIIDLSLGEKCDTSRGQIDGMTSNPIAALADFGSGGWLTCLFSCVFVCDSIQANY